MGQFLFTEIIKNRGNKDIDKKSLNRWIDETYQNRKEVVRMEKWRWILIPLVMLGMVVFALSIYST